MYLKHLLNESNEDSGVTSFNNVCLESLNKQFINASSIAESISTVTNLITAMESIESKIKDTLTVESRSLLDVTATAILKPYGFKNVGLEFVSTNIKDLWVIKKKLILEEIQALSEWNVSNNVKLSEMIDNSKYLLNRIPNTSTDLVEVDATVEVNSTSSIKDNNLQNSEILVNHQAIAKGISRYVNIVLHADLSNEAELRELVKELHDECYEINKDILKDYTQVDLLTITKYAQLHDISDTNEAIKYYLNDTLVKDKSFISGFWLDDSKISITNLAFVKEKFMDSNILPLLTNAEIKTRLNDSIDAANNLINGHVFKLFKRVCEECTLAGDAISLAANNSSSISANSRSILNVILHDITDAQGMIKDFTNTYIRYMVNQIHGNIQYAMVSIKL